jgi:hypothetical protein
VEKLMLLFGVLSLVFLFTRDNQGGFSFAYAGVDQQKLNPVVSLLQNTSRVLFEGLDKVKEEIGKV